LGLTSEAGAAYRESIDIAATRLGPGHPQYGILLRNYARFLRQTGHKTEAKALEAESRQAMQQSARDRGLGMTVDVSAFRPK